MIFFLFFRFQNVYIFRGYNSIFYQFFIHNFLASVVWIHILKASTFLSGRSFKFVLRQYTQENRLCALILSSLKVFQSAIFSCVFSIYEPHVQCFLDVFKPSYLMLCPYMDLHDETNQLKDISTWCAIKEQQLLLLFYMKTSLCMCIMYYKKKENIPKSHKNFLIVMLDNCFYP